MKDPLEVLGLSGEEHCLDKTSQEAGGAFAAVKEASLASSGGWDQAGGTAAASQGSAPAVPAAGAPRGAFLPSGSALCVAEPITVAAGRFERAGKVG